MGNEMTLQPNDLSTTSRQLLTPSQQTLAVEMHLTALNAKISLDSVLVKEFRYVFDSETPDAIRWAWREWRDRSPYFPALAEIRSLHADWHRRQREAAREVEQAVEREQLEEARKSGKLADTAELKVKLAQIASAKGMPEHERKMRDFELRSRHTPAIPSIQLTPEQIRKRREAELAEISSYAERW